MVSQKDEQYGTRYLESGLPQHAALALGGVATRGSASRVVPLAGLVSVH
jgi:hypothetical protein